MKNLDLGKQVGPLPLGGWIAVVGGGLAVGYFINRRGAESSATVESEEEAIVGEPSGAGGGQFIYDPPTVVKPEEEEKEPDSNFDWSFRAKNYLTGLPGIDAVKAANAVERYLAGMSLSTTEKGWINLALAVLGPPPEPITPVDIPDPKPDPKPIPKPDPKPPPKPPAKQDEGHVSITSYPRSVRAGGRITLKGQTRINNKIKGPYPFYIWRKPPGSKVFLPLNAEASGVNGQWLYEGPIGTKKGPWVYKIKGTWPGIKWHENTATIHVV